MNEVEIVRLQVDSSVALLKTNIIRYYDVLHELKRLSLLLLKETSADQSDIEKWFESEGFDICPDGFWQSISSLEKHRQGILADDAISFSCRPDLRRDYKACFRMYSHRNTGNYLSDIRSRMPDSAWIYYQDSSNIALQYPYIDQASAITPDFDWSTYHTWVSVAPENNPEREIRWTAPSIDYAGEGLIISVSIPIYLNNDFAGLWSIDLPMKNLYQDYINENHIPEQQNFITGYNGEIIIHPIIETKIDIEKGSIFQERIDSIGREFAGIDLEKLILEKSGRMELSGDDHRRYIVFFKTIPEIKWILFSIIPKDRVIDVVNSRIKAALDKVRSGDFHYRLQNLSEFESNNILVTSFNEMAEALEAQHEQILESQRRIAQAEKLSAIGTLAGGVAHDFNNLLQAINGYTQLLLLDKDKKDTEYQDLLAIQKAGLRASGLVRQLLLFSRESEMESVVVDLNLEIEQACRILERTIPKMIEIEVHRGKRLRPIMADPIQIEQILLNLGKNASDAMPEGGKLVFETDNVNLDEEQVQTRPGIKPGMYVLLTVSDTGLGMDKESVDKIFEPFYTTKEIGKGTGLGLASVYGIVKSHGGHVTCYSEIDHGTTFRIYLPAVKNTFIGKKQGAEAAPLQGGSETILLVDDEKAIRNLAHKILEKFGYRVLTASSGEEALNIYLNHSNGIDLVIMDIGMPGMGGHKCLQKLLQMDPGAKVIVASGYSFNSQAKKSIDAGAVGYVGKPYQVKDLLQKARSVLDAGMGNQPPIPPSLNQ